MEILPSEYQQLELSRSEKIFVRNIMSNDKYGYLILKVNPAMLPNETMHVLLTQEGVIIFKFFEGFVDASQFGVVMPFYINSVYNQTKDIISKKLISNKALVGSDGKIKFPVAIVYVFPAFDKLDIGKMQPEDVQEFVDHNCIFKTDLHKVRSSLSELLLRCLNSSILPISADKMMINDNNINSVLQRIAPQYVTIRVSTVTDEKTSTGADNELLVVTDKDIAVKAYRLDEDQINIVNKISKGDQLILACAGSGKSVLLIAKCFKAAEMNPDKKFLITCYNRNLQSLYTWFIDRAGLRAKNVTCLTFHTLCKQLLTNNGFLAQHSDFDGWVTDAIARLNRGQIKERYYGIFIDEVQEFSTDWYKFCFNLLENKDSGDHLFVICGDKTQKIKSQQKHGKAPWNAGEGYPNYRGGNKNIRIEKNYRNCIEINEYINRYVSYAKLYLNSICPDAEVDPDMFLRGKSVFHGPGVTIKKLYDKSNHGEAKIVYDSICYIHDEHGIPYDEIAVVMYNATYKKKIEGWAEYNYNLETPLASLLVQNDIPITRMYDTDSSWGSRYGDDGGVRFIKFASVLGLDFRAAIVCGLIPLGDHDETKHPNWKQVKDDEGELQEKLKATQDNIRYLYVACTRAKEVLHIIMPESGNSSVYMKMLSDSAH